MDKILIDNEVQLRLQNIALKSKVTMSEVIETLLNYHSSDQLITDYIKSFESEIKAVEMADAITKHFLEKEEDDTDYMARVYGPEGQE